MSNIVTVNSGSAIGGSLKAGRISISTDSSVTPSSGGKTWYNMINPAGGYTFISDPKVQGYNDGPPIIYPTQTTLPSDILATINGLPDRRGSVPFDNVWDALVWVQSTGKYFLLNETLSGGNVGSNSFVFLPSNLSSYSQSGSIAYNLGEITNGDLINSPEFNLDGWFDFSGTDDYIYFNNLTPIDVYSFEVVFKPHKTIAPNTSPDNSDYSLIGINTTVTNANGINVYEWTGGMTNETVSIWENGRATGITDTVDKRFHHMVFNWNGSTYDIWLDGEKKSTINRSTGPAGLLSDTNGIVLGHNLAYNYYHSGSIADVKAHTSALTDDQILQNYYGAPIVTTNFPHRWDAGNIVSYNGSTPDKVYSLANGSNSGSLYNGLVSTLPYGGTWEYDGVDDRIVLNSQITPGNGNWTLTAWVKGRGAVVGNSNGSPIASSYGLSNAGNIVQYNYDGAWKSHTGNTTLSRSEWYMLTWVNYAGATAQDGTMKMYVNGVADSSTFNSYTTNGGPLDDIGHSVYFPSGQQWFNGNIANIQLNTGTAFTDDEVSQQYNAEYPRFKSSRDMTGGKVLDLDFANPNSYISGTSITDVSNQTGTGTLTNGPIYTIDNGGILDLDGTNDYVMMDSDYSALEFQPQDPFTVLVWAKFTTNSLSSAIVANMINGSGYAGWDLWGESNSKIAMHLITGWSANAMKLSVNFAPTPGKWYLVGYTYDGSAPTNSTGVSNSVDFYIDGEVNASGKTVNADGFNSSSETIPYTSAHRFKIGSRGTSTQGFTQGLSQDWTCGRVLVFNKNLTPSEIKNIYTSQSPRYQVQLPRSTTDSLALDVDFGNTTSYPRTGTTVYDRSGNGINGTATNGPVWNFINSGIYDFDGTDDYIGFGTSDFLYTYTDAFTLEIWVNPDAVSGFKHLIGKTYANYRLAHSSAAISFRLDANNIATSGGTLVVGEWTHIVASWNPTTFTAKVYQDGEEVSSVTDNTVNWTSGNNDFRIASSAGENYYFDGKVSNAKVYSRVLSPSEVLENYKSTRSRFGTDGIVTSNLELYLDAGNIDSFDNSGTTWTDLSGNGRDGTLTNNPLYTPYKGGGIDFDGTDDYVEFGNILNIGLSDVSFGGVVKRTGGDGETEWIFSKSYAGSGVGRYWADYDDFNKLRIGFAWAGGHTNYYFNTNVSINTQYHYFAVVDRDGYLSLYLNGKLDAQHDISSYSSVNMTNTYPYRIGCYTAGDQTSPTLFLNGIVSQHYHYSRALTAAEVLQNYNAVRNRFGLD